MTLVKVYRLFLTSDVIESTNLAACKSRHRGGDRENAELVFAIGGSAMKLALVEESQSAGGNVRSDVQVSGQSQDVGFSVALPCSCRSP
jgi:hypothetical protein